jgi:small subunit ribosomal protein S19
LWFKEEKRKNNMARSIKKGPYIDQKLLKKINRFKSEKETMIIKTWARNSQISPEMIGYAFAVHNGKDFIPVKIVEEMVGHRLGEFSPTRKFVKHGGKIQKEIEMKKKEAEKTAAKAEKKK